VLVTRAVADGYATLENKTESSTAHANAELREQMKSADQTDAGPQTKETSITTATITTMVVAMIILLVGTNFGIGIANTCALRT